MDHILEGNERILVCLSPSPSNKKVVEAAAKMARAFQAALTAIYIKPTNYHLISEKDKRRLQSNIEYAEQCGASVSTIIGNDVPVQIAEYAHISGATKIVVGRSGARRRHFWSKAPLTEQIILNAPDLDVYIIPDSAADLKHRGKYHHGVHPGRSGHLRDDGESPVQRRGLPGQRAAVQLVFHRAAFQFSHL